MRRRIYQWQNWYCRSHRGLSCWQPPVQSAIYAALSTPTSEPKFRAFETLYIWICPTHLGQVGRHWWGEILICFLILFHKYFHIFVDILENIISRSWSYILQLSKKWCSSSTALQHGHSRSAMGVLGLVYLPRPISNGCELARSLLIATLYLASFTRYKYISLHDIL